MGNKSMSIVIRILAGIIGVLGLFAAGVGMAQKIDAGAQLSAYINYPFIAFACAIFLYVAFTGKNPLRTE